MASTGKRNLVAVVLLILFILIMLSLLYPLEFISNSGHKQVQCAWNIGQIVGACETYAADSQSDTWPFAWATGAGAAKGSVEDTHQARMVTVHAMALLTLVCNEPLEVFRCPQSPFPGPHVKPSGDAAHDLVWGASPDANVGYALDWAASRQAGSDAIVMTDRDPMNHHGSIIAGFADGHTKRLKGFDLRPDLPITTMRTEGSDGKPVPMTAAAANDVYSPSTISIKAQLTQDGGDPTHGWVK